MKSLLLGIVVAMAVAGCVGLDPAETGPEWKPIGKRKVRVVLWGVTHNHAKGKFDGLRQLPDLYEIVGQAARHAISASSYRCAHNDWTLGGIGCRIRF